MNTILEQNKEREKKIKKIAKSIGNYNYTPLVSRIFANVLVELSEASKPRRDEVLALFIRIVNGSSR